MINMLFSEKDGCIVFHVKILANASTTAIVGVAPTRDVMAFKMHVKAPPEKGKANSAVVAFLADILGVTKRSILIKLGKTNTLKTIYVSNSSLENVQNAFKNLGFCF